MRQSNLWATLLCLIFTLNIQLAFSQNDKYWTLEDCIEFAWQNNLQLKQQKLSVNISRENLDQSRADAHPNLNARVSHAYDIRRIFDPFTDDFIADRLQSNNFSVTSGVNLFNGFQLRNIIRQNEYDLQAEKFDLERSYNDVALTVASYYLQILFSIEMLENANNQLEISRQQVERTQNLVEAGTLPRGSLLTIQAQMATDELNVVNAKNQLDIDILNLRQAMYLPEDKVFNIAVPQVDILPDEELQETPMMVFQTALQTQPEVKAAGVRVLSAERRLAVSKGTRSPSLELRGSLGTGYSNARHEMIRETVSVIDPITGLPGVEFRTRVKPFNDQIRDNFDQSLGLFLSIPILNNHQVRSNISRSKINLENAWLQNQIVHDQLFKTIQQAHADAQAALKRYRSTEKNVVALEEAFRHTEQRFNVGMVNTLEFNDAKNRLSIANSELLQSKYEYVFRSKILEFYMGIPLRM